MPTSSLCKPLGGNRVEGGHVTGGNGTAAHSPAIVPGPLPVLTGTTGFSTQAPVFPWNWAFKHFDLRRTLNKYVCEEGKPTNKLKYLDTLMWAAPEAGRDS